MRGHRTIRSMLHYWLLLSWFGSVSLQYINVGPPPEALVDPLISNLNGRLPFNFPPPQGEVNEQNDPMDNMDTYNQFYQRGEYTPADRKRRTIDAESKNWLPNILNGEKRIDTEEKASDEKRGDASVNQDISGTDNDTETETISLRKRSFSPWGGKRSEGANIEQMWSWKRSARNREPSMPKRVRFSPWGGKRSGQVIYKPGARVSRVIYSTSMPALTRILSNYSPSMPPLGITGYEFRPSLDKRHPIKILAMSAQSDHIREALPFNNYLSSLPSMFKPGHPYLDLNLKKDGKRKVVFSQWGGKRSPPIIGPIWTPAPNNIKEATLDAILLIRNNEINDIKEDAMKAL